MWWFVYGTWRFCGSLGCVIGFLNWFCHSRIGISILGCVWMGTEATEWCNGKFKSNQKWEFKLQPSEKNFKKLKPNSTSKNTLKQNKLNQKSFSRHVIWKFLCLDPYLGIGLPLVQQFFHKMLRQKCILWKTVPHAKLLIIACGDERSSQVDQLIVQKLFKKS